MPTSSPIDHSLADLKSNIGRRVVASFSILCCIALPLSLYRWFQFGFDGIYVFHLAISLSVWTVFFFNKKGNYHIDFMAISLVLTLLVLVGVVSFGIQSGSITFVVFTAALVGIVWGKYWAIGYVSLWALFMLFVGYGLISGWLHYAVPPDIYANSMSAWVMVVIGVCITITFTITTAAQGFKFLLLYNAKIEEQKQKLEYLANHDNLTGYYVARLVTPMLEQAIANANRDNQKLALVFADLNNFKLINDNFGHDIGDQLITLAAQRLAGKLRENDLAFRIGGDEFLYLLNDVNCSTSAIEIVQRMLDGLSQSAQVGDFTVEITACMGVAIYPDDGKDPDELKLFADKAMYAVKGNPEVNISLYAQCNDQHDDITR